MTYLNIRDRRRETPAEAIGLREDMLLDRPSTITTERRAAMIDARIEELRALFMSGRIGHDQWEGELIRLDRR